MCNSWYNNWVTGSEYGHILFKQKSYPRVGTEISCYTACCWCSRSSIAAQKQPPSPTFHQISNFGIEQSSKHEAQNLRIQPKCSNSFLSWKFRNPIITSLSSFLKALSYPKPTFIRRTRGRCLVTFWSEIFLLFTSSYDKHDVLHYNPYFVFVSFSSHFRK